MNLELFKILSFALDNYEKISAKIFGGGELYLKIYTKRPENEVLNHFEQQNFNTTVLEKCYRNPKLIENDHELGLELIIDFDIPDRPMLTLISNEPED
jgi:hypothetical protein